MVARDRYTRRNAAQGETRSHGFFYRASSTNDEMLSLPVRRADEPGFRGRLRWYQAATFLRLALVHGLRPGDRELREPLVALAARCLDDRRRGP